MPRKTVLIAGASGLVGYAAMKHFGAEADCDVIAVSRRRPDETYGARFVAADLTDARACAEVFAGLPEVTHLVYAALYERPGLVAGWREAEQIAINEAMLRHILEPLEVAARDLRHVTLLQGTKAYGVHVRPIPIPAREGRDEARDIPNFYWNQEEFVRARQRGKSWHWSILRPVLIVGESTGSAMNVIPALGAYAALLKADGHTSLAFPGGVARVAQAVDADLLARVIGWCGEAANARNETFNVTNGDVFTWPNVWPSIARALGLAPGAHEPASLVQSIAPRQADWAALAAKHRLVQADLAAFVGLSFQYADYTMGYGRTATGPPSFVSTIKLQQVGFHEVMDTEAMFAKWFALFQEKRLLPPLD
jgi:nucleoside-diphosphate-sugar epimerase